MSDVNAVYVCACVFVRNEDGWSLDAVQLGHIERLARLLHKQTIYSSYGLWRNSRPGCKDRSLLCNVSGYSDSFQVLQVVSYGVRDFRQTNIKHHKKSFTNLNNFARMDS